MWWPQAVNKNTGFNKFQNNLICTGGLKIVVTFEDWVGKRLNLYGWNFIEHSSFVAATLRPLDC